MLHCIGGRFQSEVAVERRQTHVATRFIPHRLMMGNAQIFETYLICSCVNGVDHRLAQKLRQVADQPSSRSPKPVSHSLLVDLRDLESLS